MVKLETFTGEAFPDLYSLPDECIYAKRIDFMKVHIMKNLPVTSQERFREIGSLRTGGNVLLIIEASAMRSYIIHSHFSYESFIELSTQIPHHGAHQYKCY